MISINPALLTQLQLGFKKDFLNGLNRAKTLYDQVAMTVQSTNASEVYPILGRVPTLREWLGDRGASEIQVADFQIKNRQFEGTLRIPRNSIEDDSFGLYGNLAEMLGDTANRFPDKLVFQLLELGFSQACYDKKNFFATDHPDYNGGTYSNTGTTALSAVAYGVARAQMMSLKDDSGESLDIMPDLLVVPPPLEETAREILNGDFIPSAAGTATQTNVWKGSAKMLVVPRLVDQNNWYLFDTSKVLKALIWQSRKPPQLTAKVSLTDDNVFSRNEFVWGVDLRGNAGYGLPQLAFGAAVA